MPTAVKAYDSAIGDRLRERRCRIVYSCLSAAATSESLSLGTALPSGAMVLKSSVDMKTAFAGTSITGLTVIVGDSSDDNALVASTELISGAPAVGRRELPGTRAAGSDSGSQLLAKFSATGGNVSAMTAGELDITVVYVVTEVVEA